MADPVRHGACLNCDAFVHTSHQTLRRTDNEHCVCGEDWPCRKVELVDLIGLRELKTVWLGYGYGDTGATGRTTRVPRHGRNWDARRVLIDLDGVLYRFQEEINQLDQKTGRSRVGGDALVVVTSKLAEIRTVTDEERIQAEMVADLPRLNMLVELRLADMFGPPMLYATDERNNSWIVLEIGTRLNDAGNEEFVFVWDKRGYTPPWFGEAEDKIKDEDEKLYCEHLTDHTEDEQP